jgi:hypothetical protein
MPVSAEAVLAETPTAPDKLDKAAKDFESLIVGELLKSMRATMPKGLSGGGFDRDVVVGMFDEQIAKCIAETGAFGVGDMVRGGMSAGEPAHERLASALVDDGWVQPVDDLPEHYGVGQRFGAARAHAGDHRGLDIAQPVGTPVYAARAGTVVGVCHDPSTHGGLQVTIAHDNGSMRTRYMHLDGIDAAIKPVTSLAAGTTIGTVGNTGTSSHGAHLHFEVEQNGTHVDPQRYVPRWRQKP